MKRQEGQAATAALATILGLVLIVGLAIGGWQLGWFLKSETVNRNAKINRTSYEVQQTYHEKVLSDMDDVRRLDSQISDRAYADQVFELRAQRIAAIRVTCDHISRLTTSGAGLDPDIQSFDTKECAF